MSPYVARRVLDIQHEVNKKNYIQLLSDREKEILELLRQRAQLQDGCCSALH